MLACKDYKFWFCTGSQDLYGDECLAHVAEHSKIIVKALNDSGILPYEIIWKPTLITNEVIRKTFNVANTDENCAGVITWCHTFSPAKSSENRCFIFIHSSIVKSHMIRLIWIS